MRKINVEVCLKSARGLRRSSSLWKLQWFAVGWIDPNAKYCTKIDASGSANPVWNTKFSTFVEYSGGGGGGGGGGSSDPESNSEDHELALHVQVYSREPIFLRERLQGSATVNLKEFLTKNNFEVSKTPAGHREVESFQLRKPSSSKPQGFVDISIHISEEREETTSYPGNDEGFKLMDCDHGITSGIEYGGAQTYRQPLPLGGHTPQTTLPYMYPVQLPVPDGGNCSINASAGRPSYPSDGGTSNIHPPQTQTPPPPPPPPPSNIGYIPTFLPGTNNLPNRDSYVNMPSSSSRVAGASGRPGFGMGVGAGALAAGAVIFGDDFMSGFHAPTSLQDASLAISANPPF
ncbi:uncharacterized protein LOC131165967 [Malania oleifera]|uniref:uncharacterized protein LOC131165967 n=1 Tax=Malania oleifera TaxID=397392 RepID=UPI0025ADEC10|nr:uncharacterized protein LOC131165967 [Malania oleifera]